LNRLQPLVCFGGGDGDEAGCGCAMLLVTVSEFQPGAADAVRVGAGAPPEPGTTAATVSPESASPASW
jgi:hypothetical protein